LLQLVGLVRWRWAWTIAPIVLLYCLLTGSPASAVRATVMALAILLAWRLGRPLNALACWSLAFLALLIWNPLILLDPGAQLSFALVLSLILIAPPLMRLCLIPFAPDPFVPRQLLSDAQQFELKFWRGAVLLLASGIAAVIVCEPITAINFHQITPISILANLVVVPLAGLITAIGTMSLAVSLICTPVSALINNSNWLLAKVLLWFVGLLAHQPGSMINVPDLAALKSSTPSFVVAPLHESACLLLRTGDGAWLINTGRETPGPSTVWHLLQFYGINRLDGLVLAQISAPDNSGAEAIIRDFWPREFAVPVLRTKSPLEKQIADLQVLSHAAPDTWREGQTIRLGGGVHADVIHPSADSPDTRADDRGLVIYFHLGDRSLLWAGRIGPQAQAELLAAHPNLRADVLVMGTEPAPAKAWLSALQVRDWLQIPPRDPRVNVIDDAGVPDFCQVWPLNRTGAVDIHFQDDRPGQPGKILLSPWVAPP
jgi:ComEC/Rec2-related protein